MYSLPKWCPCLRTLELLESLCPEERQSLKMSRHRKWNLWEMELQLLDCAKPAAHQPPQSLLTWANKLFFSWSKLSSLYLHPEHPKHHCLFSVMSPQILWDLLIHILQSHLSVGTGFFNYVFDDCILLKTIDFLGQISILYPSQLSFSHGFIYFLSILLRTSQCCLLHQWFPFL